MAQLRQVLAAALLIYVALVPVHLEGQELVVPSLVGRWDLTITSPESTYPSWLEVRLSGYTTLVGRFVGRVGSARPISRVELTDSRFRFSAPLQWEVGERDLEFEGVLHGDSLSGWTTDAAGRRLNWSGFRAPSLRRSHTSELGPPVALLEGTDLQHWVVPSTNNWRLANGILSNTARGGNLLTRQSYEDFQLRLDFRLPEGGNSGVYLRGRYEVQLEDTRGREPSDVSAGAIYGFLSPSEDAAGRPGEWQTLEVRLIGRLVTVHLNGVAVIVNREIPGITGGALNSDEASPGPVCLQGDHGPVEFRNIVLTPILQR